MKKVCAMLLALALLMFAACSKERETIIPPGSDPNSPTKFEISQDTDGRWRLLKEGEEFYINGAAANRWYSRVREFGGNVFRNISLTLGELEQRLDYFEIVLLRPARTYVSFDFAFENCRKIPSSLEVWDKSDTQVLVVFFERFVAEIYTLTVRHKVAHAVLHQYNLVV